MVKSVMLAENFFEMDLILFVAADERVVDDPRIEMTIFPTFRVDCMML
jgi:hypothetical protein